jgi:hypothetical protein
MISKEPKNRRSFLTGMLTGAAGAWVALTGGTLFGAGCVAKYGGPPTSLAGADGGVPKAARKYGGPFVQESVPEPVTEPVPAPAPDAGSNPAMVLKYGGPPEQKWNPSFPEPDEPVTKYGGPSRPDAGPRMTKYGGPR